MHSREGYSKQRRGGSRPEAGQRAGCGSAEKLECGRKGDSRRALGHDGSP